jgi:UDP-N-acetyl-D-glucosamine dehydrogenase
VLVPGLAYKKDIDDLRESPSLAIIESLRGRRAIVFYNDPFFARVGRGRYYNLNIENTPLKNLGQYDAMIVVTDHADYDYARIVADSRVVVDTRNATHGIQSSKIFRR